MASVGGVYLNFSLWAVSLIPAWLVVRKIGLTVDGGEIEKTGGDNASLAGP